MMASTRSAKKKSKINEESSKDQNDQIRIDQVSNQDQIIENNDQNNNNSVLLNEESQPNVEDKSSEKNALPNSGLLTPSGAKTFQRDPSKTDPSHKKNKFSASMSLFQNDGFYDLNNEAGDKKSKKKVIRYDPNWDGETDKSGLSSPIRKKKMSGKRRVMVIDQECSDVEFEFKVGG